MHSYAWKLTCRSHSFRGGIKKVWIWVVSKGCSENIARSHSFFIGFQMVFITEKLWLLGGFHSFLSVVANKDEREYCSLRRYCTCVQFNAYTVTLMWLVNYMFLLGNIYRTPCIIEMLHIYETMSSVFNFYFALIFWAQFRELAGYPWDVSWAAWCPCSRAGCSPPVWCYHSRRWDILQDSSGQAPQHCSVD